ncbi:MAG: CHAT domain-containing protein, partial [Thermoanaerobaculia bacterium]
LASPIADRLGDGALQAGILSSRSVVARHRFDYELAVELGEQAIALAEDAGDPDMMAAALLRTMRAKEEVTGSIDEKSLQRIIAIADHLDNIALASHAATHIGRFYEGRSERRRGFQYAELAWRYAEESGDPAARISASILLGGGFFHMNHHRLALKHFREAAELSFQVGHQKAAALATASLAHAYGGLGHDEDVERVLQDGLHRLRDPQSVAEIMTTLAQFRVGQGKPKEAEELLECVQTLVPSDVTGAPRIALLYASIRFRQGQYEEAFRYAESARGHRTKHSRSARELMAMALRGLGRTDEAVHLLESVAAERELDIDPIADPQMVVFGSTSSMHERWLDALVALGRNDEALRVSERLKATELRQALSDGDMHRVTLPASDAKRERAIVDRIAELNRKLVAAPHDDVLREELADAHNTLLDFRQRTYSLAAPEARVQHPAPFRIETLSPSLDEVAILSYVVVDDKILILLLEPKRNGARKLTVRTSAVNRSALRRTIDRYATGLDSRDLHAPAVGVELYKLLIGPIEKELRPVKQLCIIPADHLWRVPFHALGPSGKAMLVDRLAVFYAPSIA